MNSIIVPLDNLYADEEDPELTIEEQLDRKQHDHAVLELVTQSPEPSFIVNVQVDRRTFERYAGVEDDPEKCACGHCGTMIWIKRVYLSNVLTVELQTTDDPVALGVVPRHEHVPA